MVPSDSDMDVLHGVLHLMPRPQTRVRHMPIDGFLRSLADLLMADGAYDAGTVYEAARKKGEGHRVRVLIPPIQGAQPSSSRSPGQREMNRNTRRVRKQMSGEA